MAYAVAIGVLVVVCMGWVALQIALRNAGSEAGIEDAGCGDCHGCDPDAPQGGRGCEQLSNPR